MKYIVAIILGVIALSLAYSSGMFGERKDHHGAITCLSVAVLLMVCALWAAS